MCWVHLSREILTISVGPGSHSQKDGNPSITNARCSAPVSPTSEPTAHDDPTGNTNLVFLLENVSFNERMQVDGYTVQNFHHIF